MIVQCSTFAACLAGRPEMRVHSAGCSRQFFLLGVCVCVSAAEGMRWPLGRVCWVEACLGGPPAGLGDGE